MSLATPADLPESAQRVARLLAEMGHDKPVVVLPQTGKTSAEAAAGLGCEVSQIAKSIIFRRAADDAPVLVIARGINRVDESKVEGQVGALAQGDAKCARVVTGDAIGGV
ncbi:YbaK/EbsC family protein, partial [Achromobacter ruhlandii]